MPTITLTSDLSQDCKTIGIENSIDFESFSESDVIRALFQIRDFETGSALFTEEHGWDIPGVTDAAGFQFVDNTTIRVTQIGDIEETDTLVFRHNGAWEFFEITSIDLISGSPDNWDITIASSFGDFGDYSSSSDMIGNIYIQKVEREGPLDWFTFASRSYTAEDFDQECLNDTIYFIELTLFVHQVGMDGAEVHSGTSALFRFCDFLCCYQKFASKLPLSARDINLFEYNQSRFILMDLFFSSAKSSFNIRRYTDTLSLFRSAENLCEYRQRDKGCGC